MKKVTATITEDYVSFETALLLKKKGFEQVGCAKQYNTLGDLCDGYCGGRSYGKSYEKELLIENAKEVCFDKLMEACKPLVEFKIMADEWKPGIHVCGAIEVGAKKRN